MASKFAIKYELVSDRWMSTSYYEDVKSTHYKQTRHFPRNTPVRDPTERASTEKRAEFIVRGQHASRTVCTVYTTTTTAVAAVYDDAVPWIKWLQPRRFFFLSFRHYQRLSMHTEYETLGTDRGNILQCVTSNLRDLSVRLSLVHCFDHYCPSPPSLNVK